MEHPIPEATYIMHLDVILEKKGGVSGLMVENQLSTGDGRETRGLPQPLLL